jgi:hypothetical protein
MKNKLLKYFFIIIFVVNLKSFGQFITDKLVNENNLAIGFLTEDAKISDTMKNYCYETRYNDKEIKKGTKVIISDIQYCKKGYSEYLYKYFEIIYSRYA